VNFADYLGLKESNFVIEFGLLLIGVEFSFESFLRHSAKNMNCKNEK
jgi:hypothetical protein